MGLKLPAALSARAAAHVAEYVPLTAGEELLLVYDGTTFGSASNGLAITDRRIARFDKHALAWIAYADIAAIDIADDHTGIGHAVRVTPHAGEPLEITLHLPHGELAQLVAPIRERIAGSVPITHAPSATARVFAPSARFAAAGRPVRCPHCTGEEFYAATIMMSTRGMELLNLTWLSASAVRLECTTCSQIQMFAQAPSVRG